jgi:hypothetical protein
MPPVILSQYHFRRSGGRVLIWDVRRLAELAAALPVVRVRLDTLAEIDEAYWFDATNELATCRAVMGHAAQIAAADPSWPILLCAEGRVMDGMHRVMKALGEGRTDIAARQLLMTPPPDFIDKEPGDLPYD